MHVEDSKQDDEWRRLSAVAEDADGALALENLAMSDTTGPKYDPKATPLPMTQTYASAKADSATPADVTSGPQRGRFMIERLHAKGGLGQVSLAADTRLRRQVALKEMRPDCRSDAARHRFLNEAEITGRLEHPGIVPVYALDEDENGEPFYVMRFIRGESLAEAIRHVRGEADFTSLPFRELLQRFVSICQTLAYAHSQGVIHRDLKPANVMLGDYGETLVVDWGLAKEVDRHSDGIGSATEVPAEAPSESALTRPAAQAQTQVGEAVGTPAYMAPEQARGEHDLVGPAADIFALGAILYEMLTGQPPFQGKDVTEVLIKAQVADYPPPRRMAARVPRALEAICLKALAARPADRYATARALADDVTRWLADEPVSAYAEPWPTRLRRWGRRHRAAVAVGVVALAAAAVVATVVAVERERARKDLAAEQTLTQQQNERATTLADLGQHLAVAVSSEQGLAALRTAQGLTPAQKGLIRELVTYYRAVTAMSAEDEAARARQAEAYQRIGYLQKELGESAAATSAYRAAVEVCARLVADFPAVPQHRQALAGNHNNLGAMLAEAGQRAPAEQEYRTALTIREQLATEFPNVAAYRQDVAATCNNLANWLRDGGQRPEADQVYRKALEFLEKLVADFPDQPQFRRVLAITYNNRYMLLDAWGQSAAADEAARKAIAIRERLAAEFPAVPEYRQDLARSHFNLAGRLESVGQLPEAITSHRRALSIQEKLVAEFPAVPRYRHDLANTHQYLGGVLADLGGGEAEQEYRRALEIYQKLAADFPSETKFREDLANSLEALGRLLGELGQPAAAETLLRQALDLREVLTTAFPDAPQHRRDLARCRHQLGNALAALGQRDAAEQAFRRALEMQERLAAAFPATASYRQELAITYESLANLLAKTGQQAAAEQTWQKTLALRERLVADFPTVPQYRLNLAGCSVNFGVFQASRNQVEVSLTWYAKAIDLLAPVVTRNPRLSMERFFLRNAHLNRAQALVKLNRHAEAVADWKRALALNDRPPEEPFIRRDLALTLARAGDHAQASAEANALANAKSLSGEILYDLACACAVAAGAVKDDNKLQDQYAARAVELLRQAVAKGFKDNEHLKSDDDLKALRQRPDYQQLAKDLEAKQ